MTHRNEALRLAEVIQGQMDDALHELPDRSLFLEPEIDHFVMANTAAEAMVRHIGRYQLA